MTSQRSAQEGSADLSADTDAPAAQRTWSHGGQQAGWRKQKPAVALVPRDLRVTDWIAIVSGIAALAASFFDFYTYDLDEYFAGAQRVSGAWTGWSGAFGIASVVLAAASSILLLVTVFGLNRGRSVALRACVVAGFALSAGLAVVAFVRIPAHSFGLIDGRFNHPVSAGHGYGYWGAALLILAGLISSSIRLQQVRRDQQERESAGSPTTAPRRARHAG